MSSYEHLDDFIRSLLNFKFDKHRKYLFINNKDI